MNIQTLIISIQSVDAGLKAEAGITINRLLTIRNWLIGYYIVEYEQQGKDKAKYGDNLLKVLADKLVIKGLSETALKVNRQFYLIYPQIRQILSDFFQTHPLQKIHQTLPAPPNLISI